MQIAVSPQSLHRVEGSKALGQMEAARQKWGGKIPADAEGLWTWCLAQKQAVLLDLLAFCAAATIDAVRGKSDRPESERLRHADKLAAAVGLDMKAVVHAGRRELFQPREQAANLDALREAKGQPPAPARGKNSRRPSLRRKPSASLPKPDGCPRCCGRQHRQHARQANAVHA